MLNLTTKWRNAVMADNYTNQPERKSPKWLLWIPLVLLLLLGLYALYAATRDDETVVNEQTQTDQSNQPPATAGNEMTIRSLATLQAEPNPTELIGRMVILDNEPVVAVIGDRSFTIGEADTVTYALLNERLNDADTEEAITVQAGQSYDIEGIVTAVPDSMEAIMQEFQLTETQAQELQQRGYYIAVNRINA